MNPHVISNAPGSSDAGVSQHHAPVLDVLKNRVHQFGLDVCRTGWGGVLLSRYFERTNNGLPRRVWTQLSQAKIISVKAGEFGFEPVETRVFIFPNREQEIDSKVWLHDRPRELFSEHRLAGFAFMVTEVLFELVDRPDENDWSATDLACHFGLRPSPTASIVRCASPP